jgi:hypothetical protein
MAEMYYAQSEQLRALQLRCDGEACAPICPVCGSVLLSTGLCFHCFKVDQLFEEWWEKEGCDIPDVPWFCKRHRLSGLAFKAGIKCAMTRYVDAQKRELKE